MDKELWKKSVEFHGHECRGLPWASRLVRRQWKRWGLPSQNEEIVCVTENDACGVDAVQVITGCTFGKETLFTKALEKWPSVSSTVPAARASE